MACSGLAGQAGVDLRHHPPQMPLAGEQLAGEVAHLEAVHLVGIGVGVLQRSQDHLCQRLGHRGALGGPVASEVGLGAAQDVDRLRHRRRRARARRASPAAPSTRGSRWVCVGG